MKILADECTPVKLLAYLKNDYLIEHVTRTEFAGMKNGKLLRAAAEAGYDCLLTTDKAMPHEQNLTTLPLSIVLLDTFHGTMPEMLILLPQLQNALARLETKSFVHVK